MLNITIQNDGKIKIQSECSNTKEMRHNVNLLLAVVSSMETEEAAAKKEANGVPVRTSYYLYLNKVENNNKLSTVKSVSNMANIALEKAKNIVDAVVNGQKMMLIQSYDCNEIASVKSYLETQGCTCEITSNSDELNRSEDYIPAQTIHYLYLDKVEKNDRVGVVKVLRDKLNIPLERARAIVNTAVYDKHDDILLSHSPDSNYIATIKDALESVGCICQITEG